MPYPQKYPLRSLTDQEERALSQIAKASSERVDMVRRAKAVLAVNAGEPFTVAAALSGFKSADSVNQLVQRFNQQGLAALTIAAGRGRKPTYSSEERQHILEQLRSAPNREQDQSATWSLRLLQRALRRHLLPRIGASTIRRVLRHPQATSSDAAAPGVGPARRCACAKRAWSPSTIRRRRRNSA